jgi:hypothetical protein
MLGETMGVGLAVSLLGSIVVLSMSVPDLARHILSLMFLVGAIFFFTQAIVMRILKVACWWEVLLLVSLGLVELLIAVWASPIF